MNFLIGVVVGALLVWIGMLLGAWLVSEDYVDVPVRYRTTSKKLHEAINGKTFYATEADRERWMARIR